MKKKWIIEHVNNNEIIQAKPDYSITLAGVSCYYRIFSPPKNLFYDIACCKHGDIFGSILSACVGFIEKSTAFSTESAVVHLIFYEIFFFGDSHSKTWSMLS